MAKKESAANRAIRQLADAGYASGTLENRIAELIGDRDALEATIEGVEPAELPADLPAELPAEPAQHRFEIDRAELSEADALAKALDTLGVRPRDLTCDHCDLQWCFVVKPRARRRIKGAA